MKSFFLNICVDNFSDVIMHNPGICLNLNKNRNITQIRNGSKTALFTAEISIRSFFQNKYNNNKNNK